MITKNGLNLMRDAIYDGTSVDINYLAVGDSETTVTGTETQLVNETKRVALSSKNKPQDFTVEKIFDLLDSDGALTIREIGWFVDGTSTTNSGTLISRVLYSRDKTSIESIQFNRDDTIGRG